MIFDDERLKDISNYIELLRKSSPLIHCITNYVTINDCANAVLAIGASPAMANEAPEIREFVELAGACVINMGTLLDNQIEAMKEAAIHTKETNTPLVIDPIALGVSKLRNDTTMELIKLSNPSIIRGNMSEIKALANLYDVYDIKSKAKGVDVSDEDIISQNNLEDNVELVSQLAKKLNTVINVSGPTDIISDSTNTYLIDNGEAIMSRITGSGCMLTSILGAFCSVTNPLDAAITGSLAMAISGQLAYKKTLYNREGSGSFRTYLIDELYNMNDEKLLKYSKLYRV